MKKNNLIYGFSIAIIVSLLIVAIVFIILDVKKSNKNHHHHPPHPIPPRPYPNNIGGETDKHGCHISAGYQWCKKKKKCIRPWEEKC